MSQASSPSLMSPPLQGSPSPSSPMATSSLVGSDSLGSQMMARAALEQQQQSLSGGPPPAMQLRQQTRQQIDPNILARMVTASGSSGVGVNSMPIRVASMQDFRRSRNSLNTVPEVQPRQRLGNQAFALNAPRRTTLAASHRPMSSNNPLLKMMEERMAAAAKQTQGPTPPLPTANTSTSPSPPIPAMSTENKTALNASISKWAGLGYNEKQNPPMKSVMKQQLPAIAASPQPSSGDESSSTCSGRVPLSPTQMEMVRELTASQGLSLENDSQPPPSREELIQKLLLQQVGTNSATTYTPRRVTDVSSHLQQIYQPVTSSNSLPGSLTRNAMSVADVDRLRREAEVDRLRRENQIIQLRQQMAMQDRAILERRILEQQNEQTYLHQRSIAASLLGSMQVNGGGGVADHQQLQHHPQAGAAALTQQNLNDIQANALEKIKRMSSNGDLKSSLGMKPSRSSTKFRKRRSSVDHDEDLLSSNGDLSASMNHSQSRSSTAFRKRRSHADHDDDSKCSRGSLSSHTHSISSSAASSHKIHRSLSHSSARAMYDSMENLRIKSRSSLLSAGMRNQSFSSGLNVGSHSSGLNVMNNQSFSTASNSNDSSTRNKQVPPSQQQQQQAAALRRSSSSNNWIKSLLSEQNSAGGAAATFEHALQTSSSTLVSLLQNNQPSSASPKEQQKEVAAVVAALGAKPIRVRAEECGPPPTERPRSASRETVIISAVPDSIKYQHAKADTKPIDIVKGALSSRGEKCDIKPSMNMEDGFFVKVTAMYDQEIVNAIRSNDVENLRKLADKDINLQCGNRFGETLIHLACRRSHKDLVSFLINDASVSLRVRDDYGRTPMHDACWRAEPNLELLDMLLDRAPELLMLSDKRGHTPLDYARREHWAVLVPFLLERTAKFRPV